MLLKHHAAALPSGKLAVDSVDSVLFTQGTYSDPKSFSDPCPPTATRITSYNAEALRTGGSAIKTLTSLPDDLKGYVIVAPHAIDNELARLLTSLSHVLATADQGEDMIDAADGDGLVLLQALQDLAKKASPTDRALVAARFTQIVNGGVAGELTLESLKVFLKAYKTARRNLPPKSRPEPEAEAEMINLIALSSPETQVKYDLEITATPPASLDAAVTTLKSILRKRTRYEQINEIKSSSSSALTAKKVMDEPSKLDMLIESNKALAAAIDRGAKSDPHKGLSSQQQQQQQQQQRQQQQEPKRDKNGFIKFDRDKKGRIVGSWKQGNPPCHNNGKSGCDGNHFSKHCPLDSVSDKEEAKSNKSLLVSNVDTLDEADLSKQLHDFFDTADPCDVDEPEPSAALKAGSAGPGKVVGDSGELEGTNCVISCSRSPFSPSGHTGSNGSNGFLNAHVIYILVLLFWTRSILRSNSRTLSLLVDAAAAAPHRAWQLCWRSASAACAAAPTLLALACGIWLSCICAQQAAVSRGAVGSFRALPFASSDATVMHV